MKHIWNHHLSWRLGGGWKQAEFWLGSCWRRYFYGRRLFFSNAQHIIFGSRDDDDGDGDGDGDGDDDDDDDDDDDGDGDGDDDDGDDDDDDDDGDGDGDDDDDDG